MLLVQENLVRFHAPLDILYQLERAVRTLEPRRSVICELAGLFQAVVYFRHAEKWPTERNARELHLFRFRRQ